MLIEKHLNMKVLQHLQPGIFPIALHFCYIYCYCYSRIESHSKIKKLCNGVATFLILWGNFIALIKSYYQCLMCDTIADTVLIWTFCKIWKDFFSAHCSQWELLTTTTSLTYFFNFARKRVGIGFLGSHLFPTMLTVAYFYHILYIHWVGQTNYYICHPNPILAKHLSKVWEQRSCHLFSGRRLPRALTWKWKCIFVPGFTMKNEFLSLTFWVILTYFSQTFVVFHLKKDQSVTDRVS